MIDILTIQSEIDKITKRNRRYFKTRRTFHDAMQNDIAKLAENFGLVPIKEYRVSNPPGFIDVAWMDNNRELIIAFEIDSSLRSKSIEKLAGLPRDVHRVWICYSPKQIDVKWYEELINGCVMKYEIHFFRKKEKGH